MKVIYPVLSGIVATLLIMFVFGPPLAALTQIIVDFFMGMNTGSKFILGFLLDLTWEVLLIRFVSQ
jgi:PTS system fructose-specific IIC component